MTFHMHTLSSRSLITWVWKGFLASLFGIYVLLYVNSEHVRLQANLFSQDNQAGQRETKEMEDDLSMIKQQNSCV